MPIRQDVQGGIQPTGLTGFQGGSPVAPRLRDTQVEEDAGTAFWTGLAKGIQSQLGAAQSQVEAAGYLRGQQDSLAGKERQDVYSFMEDSYNEGYNRATIGADLVKYQTNIQQKALEYVNSGKSVDEFEGYLQENTEALLTSAGAQGMDLNNADWQAWLNGVDSTRNTARDLYHAKALERSQYLRLQSYSAESNAAIGTFVAADEAGNPMQALGNLDAHKARIYSDDTLTLEQKDGAFANFAMGIAANAKTAAAVESVGSYLQSSEEFKRLPTEVQTRIVAGYQQQYNQRAADEVTGLYSYVSQVRAVADPQELEALHPMTSFIAKVDAAIVNRQISPAGGYSLIEEENARRLKGARAASITNAFATGVTGSDIATNSGLSMAQVKSGLIQSSAQANGGYSGGGLALVQRGLASGASDIMSWGIEMLQTDAASIAFIDPRQLKTDADGNKLYPVAVVNSLTNLKTAYDSALRAGNQAQASQLLSGLPDAVAYGITQTSDVRSIADVVNNRANDLASGRAITLPKTMPTDMHITNADLIAGLLDTGMTSDGQKRNILGVQVVGFVSDEDEKLTASRLSQVNGAMREMYTSLQQQGRLPELEGDALKQSLVGRVTANTVRVDDGTDAGSLLILPEVKDKATVFGTVDNNIIADGLKDRLAEFKQNNPGAATVQLHYDSVTNELVMSGTTADNIRLTTNEGIPTSEVRDAVRSVEARLTNNGRGNTNGSLSVPGVGMVPFSTQNSFGVNPAVYGQSVNRLVSYEGYTDTKGFSILATHPTTGAPLNEAKYVKQPGDSPQVATQKLSMYLNDKVVPDVMSVMPKFKAMPEYLRQAVFQQLVETTYHAGNANAFGDIVAQALNGDSVGAYTAFRESALYKDAGPASRRNRDRIEVLQAVSQWQRNMQPRAPFRNPQGVTLGDDIQNLGRAALRGVGL